MSLHDAAAFGVRQIDALEPGVRRAADIDDFAGSSCSSEIASSQENCEMPSQRSARRKEFQLTRVISAKGRIRPRGGERDQVIKRDGSRQRRKRPDAGYRVVAETFEQAADVHHVRLEAGQKGLANAFGDLPSQRVAGIDPDRPGSQPDPDIVLRQEESNAARMGSIVPGNKPLSASSTSWSARFATMALGERQRIAPDTAKSARGLRTLEI